MKTLHPYFARMVDQLEHIESMGAVCTIVTSQKCELWFETEDGISSLVDIIEGRNEIRVPSGCVAFLKGKGDKFVYNARPEIDRTATDVVSYTAQDTRPLVPAAVMELRRSLRKAEMESEARTQQRLDKAEKRLKAMTQRFGNIEPVEDKPEPKAEPKADPKAEPKADPKAEPKGAAE